MNRKEIMGTLKEKGGRWLKKNSKSVAFGMGMATMAGFYLLLEKVFEAKKGHLEYVMEGDPLELNRVIIETHYTDRFGRDHNVLNIGYEGKEQLEDLADAMEPVFQIMNNTRD